MTSLRSILTTAILAGFTTIANAVPPPSPGIQVGRTTLDMQHLQTMGRQVARTAGADIVHFAWTGWYEIPTGPDDGGTFLAVQCYILSTAQICNLSTPQCFGPGPLPGPVISSKSACIAAESNNSLSVVTLTIEDVGYPFSTWHLDYSTPGFCLHIDDDLPAQQFTCDETVAPRNAVPRDDGLWIRHVVAREEENACGTNRLLYWRYDGTNWTGPALVDSLSSEGYVIADDPSSDDVAIVLVTEREPQFNGMRNLAYYESPTVGAGWINGTELGDAQKHVITNYALPDGPVAWPDISAVYDNSGILHAVWIEQIVADQTGQVIVRHWNDDRQSIRPATAALWEPAGRAGVFNLSLAKVTLGIGDGSTICEGRPNSDDLYIVYTRFGGHAPAEQGDTSALGYANGEIYLNASSDGGNTWSPAINLTNTKTPNCRPGTADTSSGQPQFPDSVCRSEHWGSINEIVSDIDVLFISDLDAGAVAFSEGTWQVNPVMYLRIPGGSPNAAVLCPTAGPAMAAMLSGEDSCGFHADQSGLKTGTLLLMNTGNADLTGTISLSDFPAEATLSTSAAGPITIPAGGSDLTALVTMAANGAAMGSYAGQIIVDHNDATIPDPLVINVSLEVGLCQCHTDPVCDGATNVQDVIEVIGRAFRGEAGVYDPPCPDNTAYVDGRTDLDCDGSTTVVDVVRMVNVAFRGASAQTEFCHICQ